MVLVVIVFIGVLNFSHDETIIVVINFVTFVPSDSLNILC